MFAAIFWQALMLFLNLLPIMVKIDGKRRPTDGRALWNAMSGKTTRQEQAAYAEILAHSPVRGASAAVPPGLRQRYIFLLNKLHISSEAEREKRHRDIAAEVDHLPPSPEKLGALDMLVTFYLGHDPGMQLENLDRWSQSALDLNPDRATSRGSRGAVLIELGRYEEGLDMLAHAEHGDAFNRSLNEAFSALAFYRLGDLSAAKAMLETARTTSRTLDLPNPFVSNILDRIGREMMAEAIAPKAPKMTSEAIPKLDTFP